MYVEFENHTMPLLPPLGGPHYFRGMMMMTMLAYPTTLTPHSL